MRIDGFLSIKLFMRRHIMYARQRNTVNDIDCGFNAFKNELEDCIESIRMTMFAFNNSILSRGVDTRFLMINAFSEKKL